jgi:hypothetical protein
MTDLRRFVAHLCRWGAAWLDVWAMRLDPPVIVLDECLVCGGDAWRAPTGTSTCDRCGTIQTRAYR